MSVQKGDDRITNDNRYNSCDPLKNTKVRLSNYDIEVPVADKKRGYKAEEIYQ
jgi:hypothetical protein